MGSIVSVHKDSSLDLHEVYPSQAIALQAKLRQAALSLHPHLVRRLSHSEAYGAGNGGPDWYPAGISPWYLDKDGEIVGREATSEATHGWMDHLTVTKRDLHTSAILIQKLVRGHQVRRELHTRQQSARKIQRVFRRWKSGIVLSASSLPVLSTSSVAPSSGRRVASSSGRVYSADTCVPQQIAFTDEGQGSTGIGENKEEFEFVWTEGAWNQQNSYHLPTETMRSENKTPVNKSSSSDNQTEIDGSKESAQHGQSIDSSTTDNVQHHMNGGLSLHMQFPHALTTPLVRTGYSRPSPRPTQAFRGRQSTGLGNHHLSDMRTATGRQDYMYPALAPGPMLNSQQQRWGGVVKNDDMLCNNGITSMKLQDANKRWIKPSHEGKRYNQQQPTIKNTNSEKVLVSGKNSYSKKISGEIAGPPAVLVETPHVEEPILKFTTKESQVCSIVDNVEVVDSVCPIQNVDSMLELLSQGMNKPLDQIPVQQDNRVRLRVTRELVHTVHSVVKRQLTANGGMGGVHGPPGEFLFQPFHVETLLRAAQFRDDVVHKLKHLTSSIRLDYYQLMDDIDRARFYTAQQVEAGLPNYQPQRIVLISSNIPKAQRLRKAVRDDVLATVYDFSSDLGQVLEAVRELLEGVTAGAKAKHIAIVTKGGPGYVYLVRKTPLTPAKLKRNQAMLKFWRGLGGQMSKLFPGQSTIHFMESNMGGNKQGEKLLMDLESVLYAHQVQFSCPLEMAAKGRAMINMYFIQPSQTQVMEECKIHKTSLILTIIFEHNINN